MMEDRGASGDGLEQGNGPGGASPDSGWQGLAGLAGELARARRHEVPSLAPSAFGAASAAFEAALEASGSADRDRSVEAIERAHEAIAAAERRGGEAARVLADLPGLRSAALRDEVGRYHAGGLLAEAETHVRRAIACAEDGDPAASVEHADAARRAYAEATLATIEGSSIDALEAAVREAEPDTSESVRDAALGEVARLRAELVAVRAGDSNVSDLRRRIALGARRIGTGLGDLGDRPPIGPIGPKPPDKPARVDDIRVVTRRDRALDLVWLNPIGGTADRNVLMRQREPGPWEEVVAFGAQQGWTRYTDSGLEPDTLYSYRVRSENAWGIVMTPIDQRAGGYTRATRSIGVWRTQLRIRVADVADAGTSDAVQVRLTSPLANFNPHGNQRWLDSGPRWEAVGTAGVWRDDFARGREFVYDLDQRSVGSLADITMLTIAKDGSDAVAIAEFALLVNEVEVFARTFGETSATCLWLDDSGGHDRQYTVWHDELRADPRWQAFVATPPGPQLRIPNDAIVSRIEGMVGHAIHGTEAHWGEFQSPNWVEATFADNPERLHVDLDLEADVTALPDPEIDIDFDLLFRIDVEPGATTAVLRIESANVNANVDFDLLTELFGNVLLLGQFGGSVEDYIAKRIEADFAPIVEAIQIDVPAGSSPIVRVEPNGSITFWTT